MAETIRFYPYRFAYTCKFKGLDEGRRYDIMNIGSSNECSDIDYVAAGANGINLAMTPQSPYYSLQILKAYSHLLNEDGVLLLPVCPFSSCLSEYKSPESHYPYYAFLKKEYIKGYSDDTARQVREYLSENPPPSSQPSTVSIMDEEAMKAHAKNAVDNWWMGPFGIKSLSEPFPEHLVAARKASVEVFKDMITIANEKNFRPYFLLCPISSYLKSYLTKGFYEEYIYSFMREINADVPVLNFLEPDTFSLPGLYQDSFILNQSGRRVFTDALLREVDLI